MRISLELSEKIAKVLNEFITDSEPFIWNFEEPIDLRKVAEELKVLPMVFDFSGCYAINSSGEIVAIDFNESPLFLLKPEIDPRICRLVLFQGVKKYPELIELMPIRPIDAEDCLSCDGTGIEPMNIKLGFETERIVCWCGGLGWLAKGEKQLS